MLHRADVLIRRVAIADREWWDWAEAWLEEYESSRFPDNKFNSEPRPDADEAAQRETLNGG
jgi:hypothetical protein